MPKVIVLLLVVGVIGFALLVELTQPPAEPPSALAPATAPVVSATKDAAATGLPVLVDDERWSVAGRWNEHVLAVIRRVPRAAIRWEITTVTVIPRIRTPASPTSSTSLNTVITGACSPSSGRTGRHRKPRRGIGTRLPTTSAIIPLWRESGEEGRSPPPAIWAVSDNPRPRRCRCITPTGCRWSPVWSRSLRETRRRLAPAITIWRGMKAGSR